MPTQAVALAIRFAPKVQPLVQLPGKDWQAFGSLVKKGQSLWLGKGLLTNQHRYSVNLLAHWQPKENASWQLATNLDQPHLALRAYARRMWIEEMFGDLKGHGFDLESSHVKSFLKLSRLTFAVVLLYVWSISYSYGSRIAHTDQCCWVDCSDRGDLSSFQKFHVPGSTLGRLGWAEGW